MLGTSEAWAMIRSSQRPSNPAYYIENCQISTVTDSITKITCTFGPAQSCNSKKLIDFGKKIKAVCCKTVFFNPAKQYSKVQEDENCPTSLKQPKYQILIYKKSTPP